VKTLKERFKKFAMIEQELSKNSKKQKKQKNERDPNEDSKPTRKPPRRNTLNGLEDDLLRWLYCVVNKAAEIKEKEELWLGAYQHSVTSLNGFQWRLREDPKCQTQLGLFLENIIDLIRLAQSEFSTQLNESLHSLKAKLADNGYAYHDSWKARCAVAVLDFNEGYHWRLELYDKLQFPALSQRSRKTLEKSPHDAERKSENRRTAEF
jgi:hypothetical protein